MLPPPNPYHLLHPPPATISTEESFFTAPTQPLTQAPDGDTQPEDGEASNPFSHLWGRLVPCNPAVNTIDLQNDVHVYTFGRNPSNTIVVAAPKISGRHCEVRLVTEPDGSSSVNLTDLSSNGTYVNGLKVGRGRHQRLTHGDEISLGVPGQSIDSDDFRYIYRRSSAPIKSGGGIHSQYDLGDVLGKGSFATVRKAWSKISGESFAVKVIARSRFAHSPKSKEMFERELAILQSLRHHNITRLVEYFEDEATIFIVMELIPGGDLLDYIINNGPVPEDQARIWTAQMVDAIAYTHRKNITHRDLKPENILLTGDDPRMIKIADFGLAKSVDSGTFLKTMCGTPSYLAPEVVLADAGIGYDSKVDCWSLGVIVWAMLTNTACFVENDEEPLRDRMLHRQVQWEMLKQLRQDFMKRLIVNDPRYRMTIREARQHPWIANVPNPRPTTFVGSQSQDGSSQDDAGEFTDSAMDGNDAPNLGNNQPANPSPGGSHGADHGFMLQDSAGNIQWQEGRGGTVPQDSGLSSNLPGSAEISEVPSSHMATSSPQSLEECSQDLADLNLESDTVHGGMEYDSGTSFVNTSVGTPPEPPKKDSMEVDGGSWQHVNVPPQTRSRKRGTTPKPPVDRTAPTSQKRKAIAIDFDSELSSVPPSDEDITTLAIPMGRKKLASSSSGSTIKARTKRSSGESLKARRTNKQTTAAATATKRRSTNRFRAPSASDDEEAPGTPRAGPSTRTAAPTPATPANEIVLRLDFNVRHDQTLTYEQAAQHLGQVIRMSNTTPYHHTYIDRPNHGDMFVIFQIPSLPPFNVDGLRYLEQEHMYRVPIGQYELEVAETKYGFIPGMNEQEACRMRRKMRFSKGGMPAVVLVHYTRGPGCPIPIQLANQPVRKYPLIPSNEPGIFVMGEKTGQKVYSAQQQQAMNGQGFPPHGPPARGPMMNPQMHAQNAAIAAQNAAMNAHRNPKPIPQPPVHDENDEDESDVVTHRDLATTRFVRNHEFLADLFSPESIPKPTEEPLEHVDSLEATLAKLNSEIEETQRKIVELETARLPDESSALSL
ncbi:hypothetical protein FRB99_005104 [Tulasnella sp. 403]|nr:hypothetical protein FRB99_005104 [Tulasnella sp. 403]